MPEPKYARVGLLGQDWWIATYDLTGKTSCSGFLGRISKEGRLQSATVETDPIYGKSCQNFRFNSRRFALSALHKTCSKIKKIKLSGTRHMELFEVEIEASKINPPR